jgi:hypothetical protein
MCPDLSDDLQQVDDANWPSGTLTSLHYKKHASFPIAASRRRTTRSSGKVWSRTSPESMELALQSATLLLSVEPPSLPPQNIHTFIVSMPPKICSTAEAKDAFYEELETRIKEIPDKENLFLLGDFNVQIGADHTSWPRCIGHFDVGKLNQN